MRSSLWFCGPPLGATRFTLSGLLSDCQIGFFGPYSIALFPVGQADLSLGRSLVVMCPDSHRSDSSNFTELSVGSQTLRFSPVEPDPLSGGPSLGTHPSADRIRCRWSAPGPAAISVVWRPCFGACIGDSRPSRSEGFANVTRRLAVRQIADDQDGVQYSGRVHAPREAPTAIAAEVQPT